MLAIQAERSMLGFLEPHENLAYVGNPHGREKERRGSLELISHSLAKSVSPRFSEISGLKQ